MTLDFDDLAKQIKALEREFNSGMKAREGSYLSSLCVGLALARLLKAEGETLEKIMLSFFNQSLDAVAKSAKGKVTP